jgi:ribose transport system ATP-binding protein
VKEFPGVRALDGVTLAFRAGEVHGVVGENGAGKSTLMKVLSGIEPPTSGTMAIDGTPVTLRSPAHAGRVGVAMIHQELNLVDELTVSDNIFLGRELSRCGWVESRAQRDASREILGRVNCNVDPSRRVGSLSIAQQQLVEIAKALAANARVLIMDEPTAVLSERETAALFGLIDRLKRSGVAVLYISHHLDEVIRVCDRITVMRDGRLVTTVEAKEATPAALAALMVGRELSDFYPASRPWQPEVALAVRGLGASPHVCDVSFEVKRGEILGFAGLIGSGRTEMAEAIAGLRPRAGGVVELNGVPVEARTPRAGVRAGIAYLSEDRKGRGLTIDMGLAENVTLVSLRRYGKVVIRRAAEDAAARDYVARLRIRAAGLRRPVRLLSGGNQQKVAIAKWLETAPRVLILDEPTRGVDVGAKREIYDLIVDLAASGTACVFISSELPELLGVCHRIAVMRAGRIVAILGAEAASEEAIMRHAAGLETNERAFARA